VDTHFNRKRHLIKKALAIAIYVLEERPGPFQATADLVDMKQLLESLADHDGDLAFYLRVARIEITGRLGDL